MIDSKLQQELRERFNPEGSTLRKHQVRMLEILIEVDKICQKHNIKYWLDGGTLLGAVRHGGFIPWDDDLDIAVMHNDYERMLDVLNKELPSNMKVQCHNTDSTFCSYFAKVRDLNSEIIENGYREYKYNGIYIDIFPMRKINKYLSFISYYCNKCLLEPLLVRDNPKEKFNFKKRAFAYNFCKFIFSFLKIFNTFCYNKKINYDYGTYFTNNSNISDIFPLTHLKFEGIEFNVPGNYKDYLRNCYKDYEKLPDIDSIRNHLISLKMF